MAGNIYLMQWTEGDLYGRKKHSNPILKVNGYCEFKEISGNIYRGLVLYLAT